MPRRVSLPRELRDQPFLFRDARELGVGAGRLRSADLEQPFRGVRVGHGGHGTGDDPFLAHCAKYAPLLAQVRFFSHLTATRLWDAPLPREFASAELLHVSSPAPNAAPRMLGIVGHQAHGQQTSLVVRHGFRTADAVATWLSLGSLLPKDELVVVGDYLTLDPVVLNPPDVRPFTTLDELHTRLASFHGRGARELRAALALIRPGSESRPETLLRLLILRGGLPEPAVNIAVTDRHSRELGRGDLVYTQWRTVVEYDGDQHRTSTRQYERDIYRIESFRDSGWRVVQVRSRGLFVTREETLARIAGALRAGGWPG